LPLSGVNYWLTPGGMTPPSYPAVFSFREQLSLLKPAP
jgi:hypothetical protein